MSSRAKERRISIRNKAKHIENEGTKVLEDVTVTSSSNPATRATIQSNSHAKDSEVEMERSFELIARRKSKFNSKENPEFLLKIEQKLAEKGNVRTKVFNAGDFVLIMGPNNHGCDTNYVAKILSFYQNQFTEEIHASIQWFYSKQEIPSRLCPPHLHRNELLASIGKNTESIDVESILGKCVVNWIPPDGVVKKQFQKNEFFYRRSFDGKKVVELSSLKLDNSLQLSKAEQRNAILSPKRISKTPSKFVPPDEEDEETTVPVRSNSKKLKRKKATKTKALHTDLQSQNEKADNRELQEDSRASARPSTKLQLKTSLPKGTVPFSPNKESLSQVESEIITSPVAASGYGKLDASIVALNILNSDENSDFDDDEVSISSTSSKSSEFQPAKKPITKSTKKKPIGNSNVSKKSQATDEKKKKAKEGIEKSPNRLKIIIPKAKLLHATVSKLKSETGSAGVRSSPRRKSVANIVKQSCESGDKLGLSGEDSGSDSEYDGSKSEISSDESYVEPTPTRRTPRPFTPKSAKRVRINDKKTTVTPIVIKMPRDKLPFIPSRPTPVRSTKGKLEKSREKLHVSAVPECLPCRENEFQEIYTFVEGKIRSGGGGCMYVSGVPGTGKTATVREVMKSLHLSVEGGDLNDFTFVDINGMRLTEPRQAYVQLLLQLTKQKATPDHASTLLTKLFSQRRKTSTVVLADELDLLWTKKQDVLYHLFDWPTHRHAKLIVVAIANTMDLPERILMNRVASRLGLTRLTFRPYTFRQLQEIISSRLNGLDTFESDAVQLASRKVAAVSGDARRCLDICRRATEIAECRNSKIVGIEHVHTALQEMFAAPMIKAICSCSKQEQLFLHAIVAEFRRSGMEEATLGRIIEQHTAISQLEGAAPVSVTTLVKISHRLATNRLILLEGGHRDLFSRIRLNVSVDDVLFSLKQ